MGYARLDDSFWVNEKVDGLSDKAFRLYVRSISFASALNTDGVITKRQLRVLEGAPKVAAELVSARAWDIIEDGWQIHNYTVHNASAEERRARASNAASKRWRKPQASSGTVEADAKGMLVASAEHASSNANGMQPASFGIDTVQCQTDAYTDQLNSDQIQSKADTGAGAKHAQGMLDASPPPRGSASHRDLVETLVQALPAKFRHDPGTLDECEAFAADFPGQFVETASALAQLRRKGEAPFPRNLRKFMPGCEPVADGNGAPGSSIDQRKARYANPYAQLGAES